MMLLLKRMTAPERRRPQGTEGTLLPDFGEGWTPTQMSPTFGPKILHKTTN